MTTLVTRLQDLATRVATECKAIRTLLSNNTADLSALATTAKTNLVAAINELKDGLDDAVAGGGAVIDDGESSSTTETWSITKIASEIADAASAVQAAILNGAGSAYDTLAELQALLEADDSAIAGINAALGNRLKFDAAQTLTTGQKAQGNANLGAAALADTGTLDTNFVTTFEAGL